MFEEIIVAGSGGQGALMMGEVLAIASIHEGNNATWLPSYGPEMRGGTANCSVVLCDEEIGSPLVDEPSIVVCFNQPSLTKFAKMVCKGGIVVVNSDAIAEYPDVDVEIVKVPAQKLAAELGNPKTLNMIMLGALLGRKKIINLASVESAFLEIWGPERTKKLLSLNLKAIELGMEHSK